jgi:hypothetical protein
MDDEEAAQFGFRQTLGCGKLLEAGPSVKAPHALAQVVQHLEMDALKDGSDFGFSALEGMMAMLLLPEALSSDNAFTLPTHFCGRDQVRVRGIEPNRSHRGG